MKVPDYIKRARDKWEYRGQRRPDFALIPEVGQESVWDYPRPPKIEIDKRSISIKHQDILIAQTNRALRILETASPPTVYIPTEDIQMHFLSKAAGSSMCEWKGAASYWNVVLPQRTFKKVGWSYEDPFVEFNAISGFISFYPSILECYIDDERVKPQPGGFYGGWITSEIVGPVKGEIPEASL